MDGLFGVRTTGIYCVTGCPSRAAREENVLPFATAEEAEGAGFRACKRCLPQTGCVDSQGFAVWPGVLSAAQCAGLVESYGDRDLFRSRVVMSRHNFGRGEYQYFAYPLPKLLAGLRERWYARLAPIASRWTGRAFPATHAEYLAECHAAGQSRPTPLLLQYGAGDYNCLHQDLYGPLVFPLQVAVLLSDGFTGGEFVLTEQRPRMQSRAIVVPLRKGDAVVFPVHTRPVAGTRGTYKVNMRHGVSQIRSGSRHTLGVIFHDAAV